ncbi:hypothetical protein PHYSODRAFT_301356 [Phytophthora sojae]|uniref:RxLR effector protein n=2 Tax=Phytophthora sojae TaxID=67593 RepID=G4ZJS4_PHYSP|nr:hypothetical protein PHYSODRAFT_301356 [Phytophthora sojae]AYR04770.1 Avh27b protein [Phytophthora sojae]EGZ18885.1 hypothetical protein PHYSODRAFT_301356 [Phytophthora sojae]|eukprot:XP_009527943.1 hypothetical protein PHYSODRAFT_301356 [Phytophthora sojae]
MRVCSVLLVAAAALIATSNAVEPSATSTVEVAEVQARGADKRFLRSHQTENEQGDSDVNEAEDGIEERLPNLSPVDDALAGLKNAVKISPDDVLVQANNGKIDMQQKLFQQWLNGPPEVRQNAIAKIMRDGGYEKYYTLLKAWEHHAGRTGQGIGFLGATNAVDELLPQAVISAAAAGDKRAQATLFHRWIGAEEKTRNTALRILHEYGKGILAYTRLNNAWLEFLRRLM